MSEQNKKYRRKVIGWVPGTDKPLAVEVDVYRVLDGFNVTDPALQHLIKKALAAGGRGHKDLVQDYKDIVHSANSALDMLTAKYDLTTEAKIDTLDLSALEDRVLAWFACPGKKTEMILNIDLEAAAGKGAVSPVYRIDLGKAYRDMAEWCAEKEAEKNQVKTPLIRRAPRSAVAAGYLISYPYGPQPANTVRVLKHECPTCKSDVLSSHMPAAGTPGYPNTSCPKCQHDLAKAKFVGWADVEAIFDNLIKVPANHLRGFIWTARCGRAGYGTNTSIRAALRAYLNQGKTAGTADSAATEAFALSVWPELANIKQKSRARKVKRLAATLEGYGAVPGSEVVISGGTDMTAMIKEAAAQIGATVRASVTPKTRLLICANKPGAKLARALELNVTIVYADNLRQILKQKPLEGSQ